MKPRNLLLTFALLAAPMLADVPLETEITKGETTVKLRMMNPDISAPFDAPRYLTVMWYKWSPKTALTQVVVMYACDGKLKESWVAWMYFGAPGPLGQSATMHCTGEIAIKSVKITEFSALSTNTF